MTPTFVPLWFGCALKTGHKGRRFALFPEIAGTASLVGGEGRIWTFETPHFVHASALSRAFSFSGEKLSQARPQGRFPGTGCGP
jgi:hypothetical protein